MATNLDLKGTVNITTAAATSAMESLTKATQDYTAATAASSAQSAKLAAAVQQQQRIVSAAVRTQSQAVTAAAKLQNAAALNGAKVAATASNAEANSLIAVGKRRLLNAQATAVASARRINEAKAAADAEARANQRVQASLASTQYALYGVATTYAVLGTAITAVGVESIKAAASYQTAFANIQRTNIGASTTQLNTLYNDLVKLSEQLPVTFQDLSGIATLGSQLGIATKDLDSFTTTVAEFAATTNVSTDAAAQDFGQLSNLLKVPASQFNNLASSVAYVGVKSVATETEVLNLATQIGASATQAGFLADQTIGLSGALASLRIQPEQARGVFLKLFSTIDSAVSEGGANLKKYADIAGLTSQQVANLWNDKANGGAEKYFSLLLKGLSNAKSLNGALQGLGITQIREANVLQRLAGNYQVYLKSQDDAQLSFEKGTFLADAYAKISATVAAQTQILINSITNLASKAGTALLPIIGPLVALLKVFVDILQTVPAPVLGIVSALTLIVGGYLLYKAALAAGIAATLAMQRAFSGLSSEGIAAGISLKTLRIEAGRLPEIFGAGSIAGSLMTSTLGSVGTSAKKAALGIVGVGTAAAAEAEAATAATVSNVAMGASLDEAAVASKGFGAALLSTPILDIVAAVSLAIPLVSGLITALNDAGQAANKSGAALATVAGGEDSFMKAVTADTNSGAKGFSTYTATISKAQQAHNEAEAAAAAQAQAIDDLTSKTGKLTVATTENDKALNTQSQTLGKNVQQLIAKSLASEAKQDNPTNTFVKDLVSSKGQLAVFEQAGGSIGDAIAAGLKKSGGAEDYANDFAKKVTASVNAATLKEAKKTPGAVLTNGPQGFLTSSANNNPQVAAAQALIANVKGLGTEIDNYVAKSKQAAIVSSLLAAGFTGISTKAAVAQASASALEAQLTGLFAGTDLQEAYLNNMDALNAALIKNGKTLDIGTQEGRDNIDALKVTLKSAIDLAPQLGESGAQAVAGVLDDLKDKGVDITSFLHQLASSPIQYVGDLDVSQIQAALQSVGIQTKIQNTKTDIGGLQDQAKDLKKQISSAKQPSGGKNGNGTSGGGLKTATEFAQDLDTALQGVLTKLYGVNNAADDTATQFNTMKKNIDDAKASVADLTAQLLQLHATGNVLAFDLKVAKTFGDTLRANDLEGQIADNNNQIGTAQSQLAAAQAAATFQLKGNTQAAIDNRAAVQALEATYEKQIAAYAAAGHSSAEVTAYSKKLRAEFVTQLSQLGLNRDQVKKYATDFDNLTAAINKVPRTKTVTVNANTAAASSNIASLKSQLDALDGRIDKNKRKLAILQQIATDEAEEALLNPQNDANGLIRKALAAEIKKLQKQISSGNYATGGKINGPAPTGKYVDNMTINAQAGEYMVNKSAADYYGTDFMNALNSKQVGFGGGSGSVVSINGAEVIAHLSAEDRKMFMDGFAKQLYALFADSDVTLAKHAAAGQKKMNGRNG